MIKKDLIEQNIITMLGIEALPDEKKVALLEQVSELVQQRIFLRILEQTPDEDRAGVIKALTDQDEVKLQSLLSGKVDNLDVIIQEEVIGMKEELQTVVNNLA